ncbi:hypothetical protein EC9_32780 [Rosistilla ulvae]|uniref:Uncharacterized protein n=1 Tax=Rosistilla ulvae TaxID=1930277 RepID=A0A517M2I3_9BACT|nr:hypothetical protein EC9_32780 [Rosistilla ulvae]
MHGAIGFRCRNCVDYHLSAATDNISRVVDSSEPGVFAELALQRLLGYETLRVGGHHVRRFRLRRRLKMLPKHFAPIDPSTHPRKATKALVHD